MNKFLIKNIKMTIRIIIVIIIMIAAYNICKIENITHLSHDDLEWIEPFSSSKTNYYKNQYGDIDTLKIDNYILNNSTFPLKNPFLKFNVSPDYLANAHVSFKIKNKKLSYVGSFFILKKHVNNELIIISTLQDFWASDTIINSEDKSDINKLVFDEKRNQKPQKYQDYNEHVYKIKSYIWIKGVGLYSYELGNGERFKLYK